MADNFGVAGFYALEEFRILNIQTGKEAELKNLVYSFNIKENMGTPYLSGSAEIYDSVGALYDFPLKGEEILVIRYRDFFKKEHRDEMVIYGVNTITDSKNASDTIISYKINFASIDKYVSDMTMLQRGFNDKKISEMVDNDL